MNMRGRMLVPNFHQLWDATGGQSFRTHVNHAFTLEHILVVGSLSRASTMLDLAKPRSYDQRDAAPTPQVFSW
jgi:hypothetical protein